MEVVSLQKLKGKTEEIHVWIRKKIIRKQEINLKK